MSHFPSVALLIVSAAFLCVAQQPSGNKQNARPQVLPPTASVTPERRSDKRYSYEFTKADFVVRHILIDHDEQGHGQITFEKLNEESPVTEPLELSASTLARITALWDALHFLDSNEEYQSERQYPHMGAMRLKMNEGGRTRTVEFNWTNQKDASALVGEYRRLADQALLVFDISVARESQPLNAPKLMDQFESLLTSHGLSDPQQLLPLLKEISTDEHVPLIARNHALRLIKKIDK